MVKIHRFVGIENLKGRVTKIKETFMFRSNNLVYLEDRNRGANFIAFGITNTPEETKVEARQTVTKDVFSDRMKIRSWLEFIGKEDVLQTALALSHCISRTS